MNTRATVLDKQSAKPTFEAIPEISGFPPEKTLFGGYGFMI
jgi:hypothetical protein